jgi:dipeptidyl aminopeptidase/acylaminoacyl peptidase
LRRLIILTLWVCTGGTQLLVGQGTTSRPATNEDVVKFESLRSIDNLARALSPNHQLIAYMVPRRDEGRSPMPLYLRQIFFTDEPPRVLALRCEIWVADLDGGHAQRITNGEDDGAGFWEPRWSPDGERLLMLSSRGNAVRYWIWTRSTGRLQELLPPEMEATGNCLEWLSSYEILLSGVEIETGISSVPISSNGLSNTIGNLRESDSSVSVLDAGTADDKFPEVNLYRINLKTGQATKLFAISSNAKASMSPDHQWVSFETEIGGRTFDPDHALPVGGAARTFKVVARALDSPFRQVSLPGIPATSREQLRFSWSLDSSRIAVSVHPQADRADKSELWQCTLARATCTRLPKSIPNEQVPVEFYDGEGRFTFLWFGQHTLLIQAHNQGRGEGAENTRTWWQTDENGVTRPFFTDIDGQVTNLLPLLDRSGLVGISQGAVWIFTLDGRPSRKLTDSASMPVVRIADDNSWFPATAVGDNLVLTVSAPRHYAEYLLTIRSGLIRSIREAPTAMSAEWKSLSEEISPFKRQTISYRTENGLTVGADVLLPTGYEEGKQYPVVVYMYPGTRIDLQGSKERVVVPFDEVSDVNLGLKKALALHGYVVLTPSMPGFGAFLSESDDYLADKTKDPLMELRKGVLPAIDKLVDLGIADPDKIGVIGHSFGGYAVNGLITQTTRFKVAVSLDGFCDLISWYLSFDPRWRYTPFAATSTFHEEFAERPLGMGGPPWKDLDRYLRNSPITYADRIQTPLMIVQGDMDFALMTQGEELFRALQRQNKRVEFVRYWGEGHVPESPDHLRDLYQRLDAWFDKFLKPTS